VIARAQERIERPGRLRGTRGLERRPTLRVGMMGRVPVIERLPRRRRRRTQAPFEQRGGSLQSQELPVLLVPKQVAIGPASAVPIRIMQKDAIDSVGVEETAKLGIEPYGFGVEQSTPHAHVVAYHAVEERPARIDKALLGRAE